MKTLVSLVLFIVLSLPVRAYALDLSAWDIGLGAWAETALTLDISTSLWMTQHYGTYHEINPIYGKHPSPELYYGIEAGGTALNLILLFSPAPHWLKDTLFFGEAAMETGVVANNLAIGLHFSY